MARGAPRTIQGKGGPLYSIGEAARHLGLSAHTLRLYEREGVLLSYRTPAQHRYYSPLDLSIARAVHRLLQERGLTFEGIRRLLALLPCWHLKPCCEGAQRTCRVPQISNRPCWTVENTVCRQMELDCHDCPVYARAAQMEHFKEVIHPEIGDGLTGRNMAVEEKEEQPWLMY